jgi:hypothetical protein
MPLKYLRLCHLTIGELLLLEAETGEQTKIIATKADLILEKEGQLILGLDGLKVELQLQFQLHTAALKHVEVEVVALGNDLKELMGVLEKKMDARNAKDEKGAQDAKDAQDARDAQEVRARLADACLSAVLIVMLTQLQLLMSLASKPLNTIPINDTSMSMIHQLTMCTERAQALETSRPATPVPLQKHPRAWPLPPPPSVPYAPHWPSASPQTTWQQWDVQVSHNYS